MDEDDIISLSSGKSENSSSSSTNDVILIDGDDCSSKSNSDVFKCSNESNDSNYSDNKTQPRLSPPVSRRKSLLNRKMLIPHDIVIIDDDTQLPGIDPPNSINNETFMSMNSSSSNVPSTPNIMNSTIRSPNEDTNLNDRLSFGISSKKNSSASSSYQINEEDRNDDYQIIDNDFCMLATKTLNKNSQEVVKSFSSFSSNSSESQGFKLQNRKNDLPKYGSFKSFNPKICFSMNVLNNETDSQQIEMRPRGKGILFKV
jgi:hypothetical protein